MKKNIKVIIVIAIAIFTFIGCSVPIPISEEPKEHLQVKMEQLDNAKHQFTFADTITYISDEKLLYFSNGLNENQTMSTNIYSFSLSGNSERLISMDGIHIKELFYFNNQFFVLAKLEKKDIDDEIGMTLTDTILICMNEDWSENWRYKIEDEFLNIYMLNNVIALRTYSYKSEREEKLVFIDMAGKVQKIKILDKYDVIMYMSYMKKDDSIFVIMGKSKRFNNSCELQKWAKELNVISAFDLPFTPGVEDIECIISFENKNLLITDTSVYNIEDQEVVKRADIYSLYKKFMRKRSFLYKNLYINFAGERFNYVAMLQYLSINRRSLGYMPIFISFNEDYTNASLRYLNITDDTLCAFETKDGKLTVIEKKENGALDIYQW